jgi:four helix bundle protein
MEEKATVKDKSYQFAIRIVKLYLWLKEQTHYELSSQVLRAGTSVGANIEEAPVTAKKNSSIKWASLQRKQGKRAIGCVSCVIQEF